VVFRELGSADFFRYAGYVQNLSSQYNNRDYYPVAWSLSVEEWYYVVFPPFLLLYGKLVTRRGDWSEYIWAALLFIACITLLRFVYGAVEDWGAHVRRVVVFRIDSIAYGFLLYLVLQRATFALTSSSAIVVAASRSKARMECPPASRRQDAGERCRLVAADQSVRIGRIRNVDPGILPVDQFAIAGAVEKSRFGLSGPHLLPDLSVSSRHSVRACTLPAAAQ